MINIKNKLMCKFLAASDIIEKMMSCLAKNHFAKMASSIRDHFLITVKVYSPHM